jgi:N-carbamoyl-L-amino-acid hydrolase
MPVSTPSPTVASEIADHVDRDRLWTSHMKLAQFGAIAGGGVDRPALSPAETEAKRHIIGWARARGYEVSTDEAANLFVRRPGRNASAAPVLTGSHIDSQPRGGRFDGIYGVLAGLEVLAALDDAGAATVRPIDVVAWTNEEGSRFDPACTGSMVFTGYKGLADLAAATDGAGVRLRDALAESLAAFPDLDRRVRGPSVAAYVEAHIEQGPVLEARGMDVGAVTGIQGSRRFVCEFEGETAHAGTAPLALRRDAVQAAVRALAALNAVMEDASDVLRYTVGRIQVEPNSPNSVARRTLFSIDLRHPDGAELARRADAIARVSAAAAPPCGVKVTQTFRFDPCTFDPAIVDLVDRSAGALGLARMRMPSGAFHDAGLLSGFCPTGMIFVPCLKGISHNEAEYASPDQLAAGARVLAAAVHELANRTT